MLVGAYSDYLLPPRDAAIKVDPMLSTMLAHYGFCHAHPVSDPACGPNRRYLERVRAWDDRGCTIYFYEYYWKVAWRELPWPIVHSIKADIPWFKQEGYKGLYTQHVLDNIWTLYPNYYVAARLLWDVDADVDATLDKMYADLFGGAAPHMKAYYETMEGQMAECGAHIHGYRPYATGPRLFTHEVVAKLREHYGKAVQANADATVTLRLKKIGASLEYVEKTRQLWDSWRYAWSDDADPSRPMAAARKALAVIDGLFTDFTENGTKWEGVVRCKVPDLKHDRTKLLRRIHELKLDKVAAYATPEGLVAYWPLSAGSGDAARDAGLNKLNGRIAGAQWAKGDFGTALAFDGPDASVDCGPGRALALGSTLSLSFWARPAKLPAGEQVLVGESTDTYAITYYKTGNAHFYVNSGGKRNSTRVAVPVGRWSHVVGTFDGKTSKLYLNGKPGAAAANEGMGAVSTRFRFGLCPRARPKSAYYGLLDDVRVYNRALADDEIVALFKKGTLDAEATVPGMTQTTIEPPSLEGWTLRFSDHFERAAPGADWRALRGDWSIKEGRLAVLGHGQIMCTKTFPGAQRLEFDATAEGPCDLTGVLCAGEGGYAGGYFVGFGTENNAYSKLLVQGVEVKRWNAVITPGKVHHQIVQREGNTLTHVVDGKVVMTYEDDEPLKGKGHDRVGFYVFGKSQVIDNVKVYTKTEE